MPPPPHIRRKPVPPPPARSDDPMRPGWEKEITNKFRMALSTNRMGQLKRANSNRPSRTASQRSLPPSYDSSQRGQQHLAVPRYGTGDNLLQDQAAIDDFSYGRTPSTPYSLRNIPLVPRKPTTSDEIKFQSQLMGLSETPLKWENPGLLDEAMRSIPLDRIYRQAEEEADMLKAKAASTNQRPRWDYQDCIVRALLKWFKEFFTWIDNPACTRCGCPTIARDFVAPTQEEIALSAQKVELYQCGNPNCGSYERFPRYNDAFVLMQTKRGRVGEWVNCFTMLCRSMDLRVRWVWNSEDRVWTEVYSNYRRRWIHVDVVEGTFDNPMLYRGWGKQIGYCIAFSAEGATDVTARYCRNPVKHGLPRTRCPEAVLHHILDDIRRLRRRDRPKDEKFKLEGEDTHESHEMRHYYVAGFVDEIASLVPGGRRRDGGRGDSVTDAAKAAESRANAAAAIAEANRARQDPTTGPDNAPRPP